MEHSSVPDFTVDELDLAIVNALQISPRAGWATVAGVLGVDASTVARRWARLSGSGAAWVSCQPLFSPARALAFAEITVSSGRILQTAAILAADTPAMTIDVSAGARDLLVTIACADHHELAEYLLERIPQVPDVSSVRSHVITHAFAEASRWRLGALDRTQEATMKASVPATSTEAVRDDPGGADRQLVATLSRDGRAPLGELAAALGVSESTTRRRLGSLMGRGLIRLRCEMARELTGYPVSEWLFVRVPSDRIDAAATSIATIPQVRAVLSAAGPFNLLISVWLRNVGDGQRLETEIMRKLPRVEVVDRSIVIRPFKLAGRLLDPRGFATGVVPIQLPVG